MRTLVAQIPSAKDFVGRVDSVEAEVDLAQATLAAIQGFARPPTKDVPREALPQKARSAIEGLPTYRLITTHPRLAVIYKKEETQNS